MDKQHERIIVQNSTVILLQKTSIQGFTTQSEPVFMYSYAKG